jgi:hypothetical protein
VLPFAVHNYHILLSSLRVIQDDGHVHLYPIKGEGVLTLLHDSDSPIYCHLHARKTKDEFLNYDALSYAWQGETPTTSINVISDNKIYKLPITPNLEAALRQLRDPEEDRVL